MFSLLTRLSNSIEYSLTLTELTISGPGIITQSDIRSKGGSYSLLTKVFIKEGPTEIRVNAFLQCYRLSYIEIPATVSIIGESPFRMCNLLNTIKVAPESSHFCSENNILYTFDKKKIIRFPVTKNNQIPDGVEEISSDAFSTTNKFNYGKLTFPSSVKTLNSHTFDSGYYESISFNSVSQLTSFTGLMYTEIVTITIPNSVTTILGDAMLWAKITNLKFEENSNLQTLKVNSFRRLRTVTVNLPESLLTIEGNAFVESEVQTISIGSKCSSIDVTAFSNCQKLTQINIAPSNANYSSNEGILMNVKKTEIIFIPTGKTTISIPETVTDIGKTALQNSGLLTEIELNGNPNWKTIDGVLYSNDYHNLIAVCGGIISLKVHNSVTNVKEYAASGCKLLTTVEFLGTSVNIIESFAFHASGITSFTLPDSVTQLQSNAFRETLSMTTFNINEESVLEIIGENCFRESVIESFYFVKTVTSVSNGVFYHCNKLQNITFHENVNIQSFNVYTFEETGITEFNLPSSVTSLEERCFQGCASLIKFICKPDSQLKTIGQIVFAYCKNLTEVVLPDGCHTIDIESFIGCTSLVRFEHKLTNIGNTAFGSCTSLQSFNFSASQDVPNPTIFLNCINIKSFTVATGNKKIKGNDGVIYNIDETSLIMFPPGQEMATIPQKTEMFADNAFSSSPKLKYVIFSTGSSLTNIGKKAFYQCKQLKSVQFPPKLKYIEEESFFECSSLRSITLPDSLTQIDDKAFMGCNLRTVKYCGVNAVNGQNVFEKSVKILVTDFYNGTTFCNNKVDNKLSVDCELKEEFIPTCQHGNIPILRSLTLFTLFFVS